jgi:hypothetical protein
MKSAVKTKNRFAFGGYGVHNGNPGAVHDRLMRGGTYRDQSTICIIPTRGAIHVRVLMSWFGLMTPMNQKFTRLPVWGMEVGDAYSAAIDQVLANPELKKWKYILTLEEDNMPPPDGLLLLLESIQKFDAVGGLYYTKGPGGQPMIYGDPTVSPLNFMPQVPIPDALQPCRGLGMGFTLFRAEMFRNPEFPRPFFKTVQSYAPGQGANATTQDLNFFTTAGRLGYRFASDNRVKVGHFEEPTGIVW